MFSKKRLLTAAFVIFSIFLLLTCYFMVVINSYSVAKEVKIKNVSNDDIEDEIRLGVLKLDGAYHRKNEQEFIRGFIENLKNGGQIPLDKLWKEAYQWVRNDQIYDIDSPHVGNLINALKTAKITKADLDTRGTQLKLLLKLEGGQLVVFKPQWYEREKIILGNVYAGKDRYGSEILSFYLSAILNLPLVPVAAERVVNVAKDILPVASAALNSTVFTKNNLTCFYGKCFYCKPEDPACESSPGSMAGAVIMHVPGKLKSHRSPWQRTYKKQRKNLWETDTRYCDDVKKRMTKTRLLDLIDVSIFDFLIQNGDRHHYETLNDKVIYLDNGKGLGNPYVHHLDILAPLYQCCKLRPSTWDRLKLLSGGSLKEILLSIPEVKNVVSLKNIQSVNERLLMVYSTVQRCMAHDKPDDTFTNVD